MATGEEEDTSYTSQNCRKGGVAGAAKLTEERRRQIVQRTAGARWRSNMQTDKVMLDRIYKGEVKVVNLKLFLGTDRDTSPERVLDQVDRVVSEIENDALEVIDLDD